MTDEWFRNETWSVEIKTAFFNKLQYDFLSADEYFFDVYMADDIVFMWFTLCRIYYVIRYCIKKYKTTMEMVKTIEMVQKNRHAGKRKGMFC
jgi:hypothetical protein